MIELGATADQQYEQQRDPIRWSRHHTDTVHYSFACFRSNGRAPEYGQLGGHMDPERTEVPIWR